MQPIRQINTYNNLVSNKLNTNEIKEAFKGENEMAFDELKLFFQNRNPEIKHSAIKTRISRLINEGIISRMGRGKYILGQEKIYIPQIDDRIKILTKK